MTGKEIIKILTKDGWKLARVKGSHHILKKEGMMPITVPVHGKKGLGPGLIKCIEKATGLTLKN